MSIISTICPAIPADIPVLADIWRRAVLATHHFLLPSDFNDIDNIVSHEYLPHKVVYIAKDTQDMPLGFIGEVSNHIETLFIDPAFHGRGIGTALVDYIVELCAQDVTLDVNEQNIGAVEFYLKKGFVKTGRSARDPDGRPYPVLHMCRKYQ